MAGTEIEKLIQLLAKLPGLGPRSARRAALTMLKKRDTIMMPWAEAIETAASAVTNCTTCGNLDTKDPCTICADPHRDSEIICVVEEVADLWALERSGAFRGRYHVLGGTLSPFQGVGPDNLSLGQLIGRLKPGQELILALNATVEGQTTAHYIADRVAGTG